MKHPLVNSNSHHYLINGKQAIQTIEEQLTVTEMIGACKFNISKYRQRLETKGQKESDLKKIETYQNYLSLLEEMLHTHDINHMIVIDAYRQCGINLTYI